MAPVLESRNGVKIEIYSRDHLPPHIHVKYGDYEALIDIRTSELLEGKIPNKKLKVVEEWLEEKGNRALAEKNFYILNPRLKSQG